MNKFVLVFVLWIGYIYAWEIDVAQPLRIMHDGKPVLEEIGFPMVELQGNPASGKTEHYWSWSREWKREGEEIHLHMEAAYGPLPFIPEYRMKVSASLMEGATLSAVGIDKNNRVPLEIPAEKDSWTLDNVVFLAFERSELTFSLDFEHGGPMLFQHAYEDCPSARLEKTESGLEIVIPRRYEANAGGLYLARVVLRPDELDYAKLHGKYRGHYKKQLPVVRYFSFSPDNERPLPIGGALVRDFDTGAVKRYSKAVLVSVSRNIPEKFGGGGWSAYKKLRYNENATENPLYRKTVCCAMPQELKMNMPPGFYLLTFYTRDDTVKTPYSYEVVVGGRSIQVSVKGAVPTENRLPVRIPESGELTLRFPTDSREWRLCGLSATWLCGLADLRCDVSAMEVFVQ